MKKTIALFTLVAIAIVTAAIFWMRGSLDGLVRTALINYGSAIVQSTVTVDNVTMTPADGRGVITGVSVSNPAGFTSPHFVTVGKIEIEIDMASIARKVIVIRRIALLAPDINYEKGDAMTNIDAVQKNIAAYLGPGNTAKPGKKMIIAELLIKDAKAEISASATNGKSIKVALPDLILKDVGKAQGGLTGGELGQELTNAVKGLLK